MEREEERERRRLRDRQRRQSMTKEQRERHLERRRRNYQLRRQRAANIPLTPLPQSTTVEPIATTSGHHTQSSQFLQGSSIQLEGFPRRLRLNIIKRLARNLASPMSNTSKPLRLNSVKRLARSLSFPSENTAIQNSHNGTGGGTNC